MNFSSGTPFNENVEFYALKNYFSSSTTVKLLASFASGSGQGNDVRTVEAEFSLPTLLFCYIIPPLNNKDPHKITLITNKDPIPITQLFGDMIEAQGV